MAGIEILTGAAGNTINSVVIAPLIQLIDDVAHLDENRQLLQDTLSSTKILLEDISNQFEHDQRSPPGTVTYWSQRLQQSLQDAKSVIDRSQTQKWCLDCFICKPRVSRQIKDWTTNFDKLLSNLQRGFQVLRDAQQIALSTPQRPETLLQPVPELGFVGLGIQEAEKMVQTWVNMKDRQFLVIGIYGLGGIGKTSLLKKVYNTYKTRNVFQAVIWITVSQSFNILKMQNDIAEAINLELGSTSNAETRKMKLFTFLKEKKFLLILDDTWSSLDLNEEVGVPVVNDKGSRVIISTRNIDVIRRMAATDHSIQIEPLSEEEGWELFCRKAFKDGHAPTKSIEDVARLIAGECKGLPLAINVVAAAMIGNATVDEWNLALSHMKIVDPVFLNHSAIDKDLYQRLKWSYNCLPDSNFQNCFLYCGAFPEDARIDVETLVEMWVGEGLVQGRETSYLMDTGREYVKLLVDRCLFEDVSDEDTRQIKAHDIVRDMAIYIAENEEKCFFRTSQHLQKFPVEKGMENAKRIAIGNNAIPFLPTDLTCPSLLSLLLPQNKSLTEVPNGFFLNLTSLRVLDMSGTKIESLPGSTWHLTQLQYLALRNTWIKDLAKDMQS